MLEVRVYDSQGKPEEAAQAAIRLIAQVFVLGYYTDIGIIARQARELGLTVSRLGGDGWESDKLLDMGGSALDGNYYSNHYSVDNPNLRVREFISKYKMAYSTAPDSVETLAYDAARLAIDAMKRAPNMSGAAIRDAIAATRDFPGVGHHQPRREPRRGEAVRDFQDLRRQDEVRHNREVVGIAAPISQLRIRAFIRKNVNLTSPEPENGNHPRSRRARHSSQQQQHPLPKHPSRISA